MARNKLSVTLDLRTETGQDIARRLIATADVLLENFRPGTLERWGLDPETLWSLNPGLVIVRVTGFGQTGPYSSQAGYGPSVRPWAGSATSRATPTGLRLAPG